MTQEVNVEFRVPWAQSSHARSVFGTLALQMTTLEDVVEGKDYNFPTEVRFVFQVMCRFASSCGRRKGIILRSRRSIAHPTFA